MEELSQKHAERMRFYLSKADEAGMESDRQVSVVGHYYFYSTSCSIDLIKFQWKSIF